MVVEQAVMTCVSGWYITMSKGVRQFREIQFRHDAASNHASSAEALQCSSDIVTVNYDSSTLPHSTKIDEADTTGNIEYNQSTNDIIYDYQSRAHQRLVCTTG